MLWQKYFSIDLIPNPVFEHNFCLSLIAIHRDWKHYLSVCTSQLKNEDASNLYFFMKSNFLFLIIRTKKTLKTFQLKVCAFKMLFAS